MKDPDAVPFEQAVVDWQRLRVEDIPRAFYGYDNEESRSERVVTYALDKEGMTSLRKSFKQARKQAKERKKNNSVHLVAVLGINRNHLTEEIADYPAFTLYLRVRIYRDEYVGEPVMLNWDANGRFSRINPVNANSAQNAIPAAGAFLFVHSWKQTPERELANPFVAAAGVVLGERVRDYMFSAAETLSIFEDVSASLDSKQPALAIHLGNSIAIAQHPFSFRPVLEVTNAGGKGGKQLDQLVSVFIDESGNNYYDYSSPEPPKKPEN